MHPAIPIQPKLMRPTNNQTLLHRLIARDRIFPYAQRDDSRAVPRESESDLWPWKMHACEHSHYYTNATVLYTICIYSAPDWMSVSGRAQALMALADHIPRTVNQIESYIKSTVNAYSGPKRDDEINQTDGV